MLKFQPDYVLVWDSVSAQIETGSSSASSVVASTTAAGTRAIFEENLRKEGLQLSYEETNPSHPSSHLAAHLHCTCIRVPLDVLRCYAEILKLRLPMKRFSQSLITDEVEGVGDEEFEFDTESIQQQQQNQRQRIRGDGRGRSRRCDGGWSWARFKQRYLELNPATIPSGSCHNIYGYGSSRRTGSGSGQQQQRLSAVYSRDREYLFAIDELNEYAFFTPSIRHRIVDFILQRTPFTTRQEEAEHEESLDLKFGIEKLLKEGVYSAAYPLHDGSLDSVSSIRHLLFNEWAALSRCFKYQPLNIIKDYFGVKIGMYFAWLGFYTTMLIPIAALGLLCFLYGLATMQDNVHIADICGGVVQEPMCPLCNKHCNYWNLSDTCFYAKLTHLFDNESTFLFSIVISLWTVIFLEYWKRYSATICYQWDLGSGPGAGTDASDQHPRAEYLRRLRHVTRKKINAITRRAEPRLSFWREKLPNMLLSMSVSWLLISLAVAAIMGVILYRISLKVLVLSEWTKSSYGLLVVNISAVVANLIFILCFNNFYSSLAVYLTEIELHRTQTEFDDSLSLKIYLLQFVNFYSSIFYIALFKGKFSGSPYKYNEFLGYRNEECSPGGCMSELCIQLAIIMVGKQILNAIVEMSTPMVKKWVKNCKSTPTSSVHVARGEQPENFENSTLYLSANPITQSAFKSTSSAASTGLHKSAVQPQSQWIDDYELLEWDSRSLFPEYLEMVLQFGFITIFISAFPLGPLFALVNNVFEMRLDGKKMLKYFRRPVSQRIVGDIGIWSTVLDTIAKIAVVFNAFILGFTSDFIPKLIYRLEFGSLEGYLQYSLVYFNTSGFDERSRPDPRLAADDGHEYANVTVCRYESFGRSRPIPGDDDLETSASASHEVDDLYWKVWLARFIFVVCFQNFVFSCLVVLEWIIPDVPKDLADQIRQEEYLTNEIIIKNEVGKVKQAATGISVARTRTMDVTVDKPARASNLSRNELQTSVSVMGQLEMSEIVDDDDKEQRNESACSSSSTTEISTRL